MVQKAPISFLPLDSQVVLKNLGLQIMNRKIFSLGNFE